MCFHHVTDDGVLSLDLLRCIILVASAHDLKTDTIELPRDVAVIAIVWFLMFEGGVSAHCVLIAYSVECIVTISINVHVHCLSSCAVFCGNGMDSAVCVIFLLQCSHRKNK